MAAVLMAAPIIARAADFKLSSGTEYKNVKVSRVEPDGIVVTTDSGIVKLFFTELPKEIQEKYHFDPAKAEAFRFRLDAAKDLAAEQTAEAKEKRRQELAANAELRRRASGMRGITTPPAPATIAALSIEAHEIGTADGTYDRWYVDWQNYSRDFVRQKRLLITVRDFSRKTAKVMVDIYFIGHPMERDWPLFVYGHAAIPVELNGDLEVSGAVEAPPLPAHVSNIGGIRLVHGADIDGWIVIGECNNQPFGVRSSRQGLLDLAQRTPAELAKLVAAYESTGTRR